MQRMLFLNEMRSLLRREYSDSEVEALIRRLVTLHSSFTYLQWTVIYPNDDVSEEESKAIRKSVNRLTNHEPIQHLEGTTDFAGVTLMVSKAALIPRPETEELTYWMREDIHDGDRIMDVCSGSGCIALSLQKQFPASEITAWEWSDEAFDLLHENIRFTKLPICTIHADVLHWENVDLKGLWDVMVSNPPYILPSEKSEMHVRVKDFEPEMALYVSEEDPLIFYTRIMDMAQQFLRVGGFLYFECNPLNIENLKSLAHARQFTVSSRQDYAGKERFLRLQKNQ